MSLIIKIGSFLLFLFAYVMFIFAGKTLMDKTKRDLLYGRSFWSTELLMLLGNTAFFVFIYLLSGFFSLPLVIVLLAGAQLGVIIAAILWGFLGSTTTKWGARSMWAGGEFGLKHPALMISLLAISLITSLAYPILAGIAYFKHSIPLPELTALVIQYTLLWVILSGYPLLLPISIGTLVSENLDEETRTRFFVSQLGGLIPTALFLAVAFWAFGIAGTGIEFAISGISFALSPNLLLFLITFFVLTVLLPYLIGARRAAKWRRALFEKREDQLTKILEILGFPPGSLQINELNQLMADLNKEIEKFSEEDKMVAWGILIDRGSAPPQLGDLALAYGESRDLDPRFKYLSWLRRFAEQVENVIGDLGQRGTEAEMGKTAEAWAKTYHGRKDDLTKEIKATTHGDSRLWLAVGGGMASIMSPILAEIGKWAWAIFSQSLPK